MHDAEILQKAIEKANLNGASFQLREVFYDDVLINRGRVYGVIFSHKLAKAFFGTLAMCSSCERHHETFSDCDCGIGNDMEEWQVRLRQMVIEENPIRYLERFLEQASVIEVVPSLGVLTS